MKKFSVKTFSGFFIFFILAFSVIAFSYLKISESFLNEKNMEHVALLNKSAASSVESRIQQDYLWLTSKLEQLTLAGKIIEEGFDELRIKGQALIGHGRVALKKDSYLIDGKPYYYNNVNLSTNYQESKFSDYEEKIAFYHFDEGYLGGSDRVNYIFFNIDDIILFYEADPYLNDLITSDFMSDNYYLIISRDGSIHYQKDQNTSIDKLFDGYFRNNIDEALIEEIISELYLGNSKVYFVEFLGEKSYLTFIPLSEDFSVRYFFVVHIFKIAGVNDSLRPLKISLVTVFLIIFALYILLGVLVYLVIARKNSDIQMSLYHYFYLKPYSFKVSLKGRIRSFNQAMKLNFNRLADKKEITSLISEYTEEGVSSFIKQQLPITIELVNNNQEVRMLRFMPLKLMFNYIFIGEDITELNLAQTRNKNLALYNQITGLPNNILIKEDLKRILDSKTNKNHALVLIDIVQFKNYNNLFGRKMADLILERFGEIVQSLVRNAQDGIYHLEADLFGIIFKNIDKQAELIEWIEKFIDYLRRPISVGSNILTISIKVGVAEINKEHEFENATAVLDGAEQALKKTKAYQSLTHAIYDEGMKQFHTSEQVMEQDLRKAIETNEFMLFLQPQYDNEKERIVAFEALLRWDNPKYRLQSPAKFIEMAEQNNMIIDIGRIIIKETFRLAKLLEEYNVAISMNVSPIQILQAGFVNEFVEAYKSSGIKPGRIAIEITETFLITNFNAIIDKLYLLRNNGFSLHLDDFGTGYSSMLYLKNLPIDTIKIDREFIKHLNTDKHSRAIVPKIIAIAKSLDLGIIAEGVEDERQNQFLKKAGCNIIQGHLISKAIPFEQALQLLKDEKEKKK